MATNHNKTQATSQSPADFIAAVEPSRRRDEAQQLDALFQRTTGYRPVMWGPSMIGYGRYAYRYASGRSGEFLATGFAPRKVELSIYIMPGYQDFADLLAELGPHRKGKSCLYIRRLEAVDQQVLATLIRKGLEDLGAQWPVMSS